MIMSFRGRGGRGGRGRGGMPFGSGGMSRGPVLQPPPLFPKLQFIPTPLNSEEKDKELLQIKKEYRRNMQESIFYLKPETSKKDIERYSDKYTILNQSNWHPDFSRIPLELRTNMKRKRKAATKKKHLLKGDTATLKALEELEKKEVAGEFEDTEEEDEEAEKKKKLADGDEDDEEEEEEDTYENEEDNDYNENYFENGEEYGEESGGSNDEAVF